MARLVILIAVALAGIYLVGQVLLFFVPFVIAAIAIVIVLGLISRAMDWCKANSKKRG